MGRIKSKVGRDNFGKISRIIWRANWNQQWGPGPIHNKRHGYSDFKFKHKYIHKFTTEMPSRNEKSIMDCVIASRVCFKIVNDVKVKEGGEKDSDHHFLTMKIVIEEEMAK